MLTITQQTLNTGLAFAAALEWYGATPGPLVVRVTEPVTNNGPHRLYAVYAFMYTGNGLMKPTPEELAEQFKQA